MTSHGKQVISLLLSMLMLFGLWHPPAYADEEPMETGDSETQTVNDMGAVENDGGSGLMVYAEKGEISIDEGETASSESHDDGTQTPEVSVEGMPGTPSLPYAPSDGEEGTQAETGDVSSSGVSLSVNITPVVMKEGETKTITITCKGVYAGCDIWYNNTNTNAFQCSWGSWSGNKVTMRVQGKAGGSGKIEITLKSPGGSVLASGYIPVEIQSNTPSISLSSSSVSLSAGNSKSVTVSIKNYSGSGKVCYDNGVPSVCDASWGSWSGWSIPVTFTAKNPGTSRFTITFRDSSDRLRAINYITVTVQGSSTSLSLSYSSVTLDTGKSINVQISTSGTIYSGDYLQYYTSNTYAYSTSYSRDWSGGLCGLQITGSNSGSGTVTVYWKTASGSVRASRSFSVQVRGQTPSIRVSTSSLSLAVGSSRTITCTAYNTSGSYNFRYQVNNSKVCSCSWTGGWSGSSHPLTVTSVGAGSTTVKVELMQNGNAVASTTFNFSSSSGTPSMTYSFKNFKPNITFALCARMFKLAKAWTIYNNMKDASGACYGMATTSGLLSSNNSPNPSNFHSGASRPSQLTESDFSLWYVFTVKCFIEAMHITQKSSMTKYQSGLSNLLSAVRSGGAQQPVVICIYGKHNGNDAGHAVLGYRVSGSNIIVYDSNFPNEERAIITDGNNWSYDVWDGLKWSGTSSDGSIRFVTYDSYKAVWDNRGMLDDTSDIYPFVDNTDLALMTTNATDFTLWTVDSSGQTGALSARFRDGIMTEHTEEVQAVLNVDGIEDIESAVMAYLPAGRYRIINDSTDDETVTATLAGGELSATMTTNQKAFDLYVFDNTGTVGAALQPEQGEDYKISLLSFDGEQPRLIEIEGEGHGDPVGLEISPDGAAVNNQSENVLSLDSLQDVQEDEPPQDYAVAVSLPDIEYPVTAEASEGGSITPAGTELVPDGGSKLYRITPNFGYSLKALYVNGVRAEFNTESENDDTPQYTYYNGAYEYCFREITDMQNIYALFAKDIQACEINLESGESGLTANVTDTGRDYQLQEGLDYTIGIEEKDGKEYVVLSALEEGGYSGVAEIEYQDKSSIEGNQFEEVSYNAETHSLHVTLRYSGTPVLAVAAYDTQENGGMMLGATFFNLPPENSGKAQEFSLGNELVSPCKVKLCLLDDLESMRFLGESALDIPGANGS